MFEQCAGSCHDEGVVRKKYTERCPSTNAAPALAPYSVLPLIQRSVSDFPELSPRLLSPSPPIAVFDEFLSPDEIAAFISAGKGKFKLSTGLSLRDDGTMGSVETAIRTSSNTWCDSPSCMNNEHVRRVTERVSNVTGIPHMNYEFAQLLEYKACPSDGHSTFQFYKRHHYFIDGDVARQQGVRILTLFIYLTNVTSGGHTKFFTDPPLSVRPRAGRAVLWPSVLDEYPHKKDPRTEHEAQAVLEGTKLAANFWIHQYDFKGPYSRGCTMS